MALTISQSGSANSTTSTSTLAVTSTVTYAVGDMVVVCVAADNQGSAGASSISSVTDSKSHTYTSRASQNNDPGNAAAGATVAIYTAIVTTAMTTSDTFTINFSPNTTSKAAVVWKVVTASTEYPKYLSNGGTTGSSTNPALVSTSITSGDAVIYALAAESNATLTGDSDTTNGSWSTLYTTAGNTGTSLTSMTVGSQYKITTGTATQSWDTTLSTSDWGISYIVLDAAARINRTATGSGTGSQSASGLHIAPRTATGSGTSNQSADDQLVHIKTATGSGTGSGSATGVVTRGAQTITRTATGSGTGSGSGDVDLTHTRTATGSGTGTSTAVGKHIHDRSATGLGVGSSSADGQIAGGAINRVATGAGVSSEDATGEVIQPTPTPTPSYPGGGNPWWRKQVEVKEVERVPQVVSASIFATAFSSGIAYGEVTWSILEDEAELLLLL